MALYLAVYLIFLYIFHVSVVECTKISFTPSDDDQLPLSTKYRDSLRQLCDILNKGQKLPDNFASKEASIRKQCAKLAKDDRNVSGANISRPSPAMMLLGAAGLASVYYIWKNDLSFDDVLGVANRLYRYLKNIVLGLTKSTAKYSNGRKDADAVNEDLAKAREARLRRFAEKRANSGE